MNVIEFLRARLRSRVTLVVLLVLVALVVVLRWAGDDLVARRLRPATINLLEQRFNSQVKLERLEVRLFPLSVRGEALELRHRARPDLPPLISIRSFTIEAGLRELWNRRIDRVRVHGLHIVIPPRRGDDMPKVPEASTPTAMDNDVVIGELLTDDSLLTIMPKRAGKEPREFTLAHLRFEDLHFAKPTAFEAELSNPTPTGVIHTVGAFGPWNAEEPSLTPLTGTFRFKADLASIDGIAGDLDAEGSFHGPLERISTEGKTRTRNFSLSAGGASFPLLVQYTATVDGTSGDTILDTVEADLGASHITARGAIVKVEGIKGRRITLETSTRGGRLEDFVRLTTRVKTSPIVGRVALDARLDVPPGKGEVIDRMDLEGTFALAAAQFTSVSIQDRIDALSRAGRGRPKDEAVDDVASNMRGEFKLSGGTLALRTLTFRVEGAEVRLAGAYGVKSERLDFRGQLRLQARMSQTQTGWKSIVLKIFDPLFKRDGAGTLLPITISGTRDEPKFGVEIKRALLRR